ncbi:MAG: PTS sugar transporter subunit IIA [Paracoccaceae bacterium]
MNLGDILPPDAVRPAPSCASRKKMLHLIGDAAQSVYGLDAEQVAQALAERESLGPTGVGRGVALPHARIAGLDRVRGIFFRLGCPIDFDAVDRAPVDLVFALLAPAGAGVEHLKALALVSRTMRRADICAKLRANPDPEAIHAILTQQTAEQAA